DDRLSLVGLRDMGPGKPVECLVKHADGTSETLRLSHSFSTPQLEWFRKGSALTLFHGKYRRRPPSELPRGVDRHGQLEDGRPLGGERAPDRRAERFDAARALAARPAHAGA